jgi:hypothetical protein
MSVTMSSKWMATAVCPGEDEGTAKLGEYTIFIFIYVLLLSVHMQLQESLELRVGKLPAAILPLPRDASGK